MKASLKRKYLYLLTALTLLCGCGAPAGRTPGRESLPADQASASRPEASSRPEAAYDLMKETWAQERIDYEPGHYQWSVASCLEVALPDPADGDYTNYYSAAEGSCHYFLTEQISAATDPAALQAVQADHALYWTRTDADSGESVMEPFVLTAAETPSGEDTAAFLQAFAENQVTLTGMDVSAGGIDLFFQQSASDSPAIPHYYKVRTDMKGQIEEILDLYPALQAGGAIPEDHTLLPGGRCDSTGLCYLGDSAGSRICVIDREGSLLTVLEDPDRRGTPLTYIGKLPEGTPLYACLDFPNQRLSVLGFDGQECRELYRGANDCLEQCLIRPNGDLWYGKGSKLFCWNVLQGSCICLYGSRAHSFSNCEGLVCGSDGKPFAVFRQGDGTFLYGFTDEKVETVTIQVEQLTFQENDYLLKCASAYTGRHPGVAIEVAAPEGNTDPDIQLSRLLTRLSQGEGPDLILVRPDRLATLQGNDALADLSELLSEEEQKQFFPGILDAGKVDGRLYGLACGASFSTLIVSDQVWPGESWTLSDILHIIREREQAGNPLEAFQAPDRYDASSRDFLSLILQNAGHSTLLDLQEGKCRFDSDEFRSALEFCKKSHEAAQSHALRSLEPEQALLEEKVLVCEVSGDLKHFSNTMAMLGEGYHAVGYPAAAGESGHLIWTGYEDFLAVNTRAKHREIIDDFLRFFSSYQAQRQYSMSWTRTDVLQDCVKEGVTSYGYPTPVPLFSQGNSVIILGGKPDGSSYLPEFLEMAGNSHPNDNELDIVRNIIREEADACFAGDRSLEETVKLIQNRVQLYLDESR